MRRFYWIKEGLRLTAAVLGATAIYTLLMSVMNGESWQNALNTGMIYFTMFGSIMAMMFNMNAYLTIIPLSLSFGGTRREAVVGLQLYRLTTLTPMALLTWLYTELATALIPWIIVAALTGAYLFFTGLGGLLGTFSATLSRTMLSILSVIAIFVAIGVVGVAAVAVFMSAIVTEILTWIVLGIGAGVYALCTVLELRAIRRLCVR